MNARVNCFIEELKTILDKYQDTNEYYNYQSQVYQLAKNYDFEYDFGCCKITIFPSGEDFVIKVPKNIIDLSLQNEKVISDKINQEQSLPQVFLPLEKITDYEIYLQKKVAIIDSDADASSYIEENFSDYSFQDYQEFSNLVDENLYTCYGLYDDLFYRVLVSKYTPAQLQALVLFLAKFHINDIHNGNIGFSNDNVYIFDYGGYHIDLKGNRVYPSNASDSCYSYSDDSWQYSTNTYSCYSDSSF